jgi:peptidoglycan/xylan/chitin deacetylase (PgdA/CDA1 family)
MRLDRFITLNLVHPLRRLSVLRRGQIGSSDGRGAGDEGSITQHSTLNTHLPILMYHSISEGPESGVHPYYRVCTSPAHFREQMRWLKNNGYQGVALAAGLKWLAGKSRKQNAESRNLKSENGAGHSPKGSRQSAVGDDRDSQRTTFNSQPVALTFDDGFQDFYTEAMPILQEFGFTATIYLPTAFIGDTRRQFFPPRPSDGRGIKGEGLSTLNQPLSTLNTQLSAGRNCLTWNEVKELHAAGIEFGSHTVNHPKLTELSWPEIQSEIRESKVEIEQRLGIPCDAFAYPFAFPQADETFVNRLKELLQTVGHKSCVTTQIGRHHYNDDALQIKRLPVNSEDNGQLFRSKLEGDYDWLALLQSFSKNIESVISLRRTPTRAALGITPAQAAK